MSRHTSFQIGGPVRLMALPDSEETLAEALRAAWKAGITPYLLGNGTNLLCQDEPMDCFVLKTTRGLTQLELLDETTIACGAGISLARLAGFALQHGLTGSGVCRRYPWLLGRRHRHERRRLRRRAEGRAGGDPLHDQAGQKGVRRGEEQHLGYRTSAFSGSHEICHRRCPETPARRPAAIQARMDDLALQAQEQAALGVPQRGQYLQASRRRLRRRPHRPVRVERTDRGRRPGQ